MQKNINKERVLGVVTNVFPMPNLGDGKFIVSIKIEVNFTPKIGYYLSFFNKEIWKITGIVSVGIDVAGNEIVHERHQKGIWELVIDPVFAKSSPLCGDAEISSDLPISIIEAVN